jgi:putative FmdB family regulatory protein
MPIYEFYCADCHTVFSFLSKTPNTAKRPACPRCRRPRLERRVSAFAISKGLAEPESDGAPPEGFDEARMEQVMAEMAREVDHVNEDDPRQMAQMMRKLFDGTGMRLGPGMDEAIRRMEAGDDPDEIEEEMGDILAGEEDSLFEPGRGGLRALSRKLKPPSVDQTLYEL